VSGLLLGDDVIGVSSRTREEVEVVEIVVNPPVRRVAKARTGDFQDSPQEGQAGEEADHSLGLQQGA
jgi:hypothetical protein